MNATTETASRVIRDKAFAKRLEVACENNRHAPSGHGRQRWVKAQLESKFNENYSPEAIRKWFAGESRPRPDMMKKLAVVLEVDEAWLSLGITPNQTPLEKRKHNALAAGAVNLAASLFQLNGGSIAFPEGGADKGYDFQAIVNGKSYTVEVKHISERKAGTSVKLAFDRVSEDHLLIVVIGTGMDMSELQIVRISPELIKSHGKRKGGFTELTLESNGRNFSAGDGNLPVVHTFADLVEVA